MIDATSVQPESRRPLIALARKWHALVVAIVFDLSEEIAIARNAARPERQFGPGPVRRHTQSLKRSFGGMNREGIRYVHRLRSVEDVDAVEIVRTKLWTDRRDEIGPFDLIASQRDETLNGKEHRSSPARFPSVSATNLLAWLTDV